MAIGGISQQASYRLSGPLDYVLATGCYLKSIDKQSKRLINQSVGVPCRYLQLLLRNAAKALLFGIIPQKDKKEFEEARVEAKSSIEIDRRDLAEKIQLVSPSHLMGTTEKSMASHSLSCGQHVSVQVDYCYKPLGSPKRGRYRRYCVKCAAP
eukprot:7391182-Pyramimonas_sp.AAC.2